jgi:hypothetical protein
MRRTIHRRTKKSKRISRLRNRKSRKNMKQSQVGGAGHGIHMSRMSHKGHEGHMSNETRMANMHNTAGKLNFRNAEHMMEKINYMNLPESHSAHSHIESIKSGEQLNTNQIRTVRNAMNLHSKLSEQLKKSGVSPEHVYPLFQHLMKSVPFKADPAYKHVENLLQGNPITNQEGIQELYHAIESHKTRNFTDLSKKLGYDDTNQMIDKFIDEIRYNHPEIWEKLAVLHIKKLDSGLELTDTELNDLKYLKSALKTSK